MKLRTFKPYFLAGSVREVVFLFQKDPSFKCRFEKRTEMVSILSIKYSKKLL